MASTEAERRAYGERLAREWAEKGRLVEGGWRAFRAVVMRDLDFDNPETRERNLRALYFLASEHVFACVTGPMLDPGEAETEGDMRRLILLQQELAQFRLEFLAPHKAGRA